MNTTNQQRKLTPPPSPLPTDCTSEGRGVTRGTAQIIAYAKACPASQLVLSGYSQGAQVLGNILGGQSGGSTGCVEQTTTGIATTAAGAAAAKLIKAVVLFGDVTHVANQTYNSPDTDGADFYGVSVWRAGFGVCIL